MQLECTQTPPAESCAPSSCGSAGPPLSNSRPGEQPPSVS
jgi:hypothetical protein